MSDLISVIMPVRNVNNYIKNAILSILQQTYKNFELIIIEGDSTDGTKDSLKLIKEKRIKTYTQDNKSFVAKLNFGFIIRVLQSWLLGC